MKTKEQIIYDYNQNDVVMTYALGKELFEFEAQMRKRQRVKILLMISFTIVMALLVLKGFEA